MINDALVNAILSFIIPGLGQAINGCKKKAILLFIIMIVLHLFVYFSLNNIIGSVISTAYHLYAAYDAYITY